MATLLLGVEELDRRNPFLRVLDMSIRPDPDDGKRRIAVVNLGILSPKTANSLNNAGPPPPSRAGE